MLTCSSTCGDGLGVKGDNNSFVLFFSSRKDMVLSRVTTTYVRPSSRVNTGLTKCDSACAKNNPLTPCEPTPSARISMSFSLFDFFL